MYLWDRFQIHAEVKNGAKLCLSSQTAERIYRSIGGQAKVLNSIDVGAGCSLEWLTQETISLEVANTGDRPIQVGSHYHFGETNIALKFDRDAARGMRLDIAAGTAVRFELGQKREVQLVLFRGHKEIYGFNGQIMGKVMGKL